MSHFSQWIIPFFDNLLHFVLTWMFLYRYSDSTRKSKTLINEVVEKLVDTPNELGITDKIKTANKIEYSSFQHLLILIKFHTLLLVINFFTNIFMHN